MRELAYYIWCTVGMALAIWAMKRAEAWLFANTSGTTTNIMLACLVALMLFIAWLIDRSDARARRRGRLRGSD
jgi:hypothetical protein